MFWAKTWLKECTTKTIEFVEILEQNYMKNYNINPFEFYYNNLLELRYIFSKVFLRYIMMPLIHDELNKPSEIRLPVTPSYHLFIALHFYATACFQVNTFNSHWMKTFRLQKAFVLLFCIIMLWNPSSKLQFFFCRLALSATAKCLKSGNKSMN